MTASQPGHGRWWRSGTARLRSPLRGVIAAVATEVVLAVGLDRLVGTPVLWSVLIALPMSAALLLFLSTPPGVEPTWADPPVPPSAATHLEASTLAGRFQDAVADQGRFRSRIQPRLAAVALASLRRRQGLHDLADLADPRARTELGPQLHDLLTSPLATLPAPHVLLRLLDRLEER
ncbi:MAG TPA: hypothetical protein VHF06_34810 [Pseudonocardiaceae bacterium]|nr:hypothetical protein [Pseudonocardiaceae bacterium]